MWARERRVWASGGEALASPGLVHTLRKKFARTLRAFRKYRDEDALRQGWDHALEAEEDLGGSYFALLTHPALEKTLAQEAMGHVHMLSHVAASALRRVRSELDRARSCIAEQEVALERVRRARMRQTERLLRLRKRVAAQHFAARSTAPALSEAAPSRPSALAMPGSAVAGPARAGLRPLCESRCASPRRGTAIAAPLRCRRCAAAAPRGGADLPPRRVARGGSARHVARRGSRAHASL